MAKKKIDRIDGEGLVCAYRIDEKGNSKRFDFKDIDNPPDFGTWTWLHFDADHLDTKEWLNAQDNILPSVAEALTATGSRPRSFVAPNGSLLLIMRGVNLNPGKSPEDMLSIRLRVTKDMVITTRREKAMAIYSLREKYEDDSVPGPGSPQDFLIALCDGLIDRMADTIADIDEEVDDISGDVKIENAKPLRKKLLKIRNESIKLRRYLSPQRDALVSMMKNAPDDMFDEAQHGEMRLVIDRVTLFIEDLDTASASAVAVNDDIVSQLAEHSNDSMFRMATIATIFLPLTLFTGLLGINVGGMPGVENGGAFWLVTVATIALGFGMVWLMKKWKMI